ncbi:TPA: hypothetical protein VDZ42_000241 [Streptococcus pyogenes]|nr:hypothetical protein [Streptococcus pyogenes]
MEIYKQRMIEEYKQLKKSAEKLSIVLNRYYLDELDFELSCPIELLQTQWHIMGAYLKILEQRFLVEGIYFND